jgi:23S rRNA (pseudouridine1915-N3)-methyltransferase
MLSIDIICVGKLKESFFRDAANEYAKRLTKYCKLNIIELPDEKIPNNPSDKTIEDIKEKECNNIISHIKKDSYIICLDLNGKELSSEQLSSTLDNLCLTTSHITFIIGGSLGLTTKILKLANYKLCFSKLTFPHQLIRIFLLEQIYRSFKISNGESYHK